MNERNKKITVIMYWCLFFTIIGFHVCEGYSRNTIKDYNNKDYLVASTNVVNKFEDNEIRGKSKFSRKDHRKKKIRREKKLYNNSASLLAIGNFYSLLRWRPER